MAENFDNLFNVPLNEQTDNMDRNNSVGSVSANSSSLDDSTSTEGNTEPPVEYKPMSYHWFYSSFLLEKLIWMPMSFKDSENLEKAYSEKKSLIRDLRRKPVTERKSSHIVTVKGGRFEIDLVEMTRRPVYWDEAKVCNVKRCLWFFKENNDQFMPYDEDYCEFLESEYERALKTNTFHKRIDYIKIVDNPVPSTPTSNIPPSSAVTSPEKSQKEPTTTDKSTAITPLRQESICIEEAFVFHSTSVMLHFTQANMLDEFGNVNSDARRPRVVKRGIEDVIEKEKIDPDEFDKVDHVCFVVHGIGEGCDMKFRTLVECVDDFRDIGATIIDAHLKQHVEANRLNGRIEFIPITWHNELHGDATGVDERLKPITLPSIPKLRQYSNTTILDVLFYTSPIYCQTIISKVGNELNRLYKVFMERNPYFNGNVSLVGHSLGSLILFDLLMHQFDENKSESGHQIDTLENMNLQQDPKVESLENVLVRLNLLEYKEQFSKEKITMASLYLLNEQDIIQMGLPTGPRKILLEEIRNHLLKKEREEVGKKIKTNLQTLRESKIFTDKLPVVERKGDDHFNYGLAGTGQLIIKYPQLQFKVNNFFALGSPIAVFLSVRGIEKLSTEFKLPKCDAFFNIFHPYDPVAYRFEPLICSIPSLKPVLMPHHKGRKRLHLELKEGFNKVSEDLKQKVYEQFRTTWTSLTEFAKIPKIGTSTQAPALTNSNSSSEETSTLKSATPTVPVEDTLIQVKTTQTNLEAVDLSVDLGQNQNELKKEEDVKVDIGRLNKGRRIDYMLQERPIESFNEYLFALASHACYWESEDTLLLLVKEIYGVGNTVDSNTELNLTDQQQQLSSWFTQAATSTLSANVQKTFSYFNLSMPASLASALQQPSTTTQTSTNVNPTGAETQSNQVSSNSANEASTAKK